MNLDKVPKEIQDYELMEYCDDEFNFYHDTVKDELVRNGEDIEACEYDIDVSSGKTVIKHIVIWTKTKVYTILHDSWGDQLFSLPRSPTPTK